MKRIQIMLAATVATLFFAGSALGAAYIKFDGVDGEARDSAGSAYGGSKTEYLKITMTKITAQVGGPLIVKDQNGKTHVLKQDGVYSTSTGEKIWVKDGRVAKRTIMPHYYDSRPPRPGASDGRAASGQEARDAAAKSQPINNLKQIGVANQPSATGGANVASGDVNGEGHTTPIDALLIINHTNSNTPATSGTTSPQILDSGANQQPAGLLLPAVQKVRPSSASSSSDHSAGDEHEIEYDVRAGK